MRPTILTVLCVISLFLASCGEEDAKSSGTPPSTALTSTDVFDITSIAQFDAEIAKARPGVVVVADFHAEWCGPCKALGPDLVALALAHPGKLIVLKVNIDDQPQLGNRFQADSIPLLVKFSGGKESERQVGYGGKDKLATWLALP